MLGNAALEIAIALGFLYLVLSLVCSSVTEWVSSLLSLRARTLRAMVARLLLEEDSATQGQPRRVFEEVLNHPLVRGLSKKPPRVLKRLRLGRAENVPDYVPSSNFASALLDVLPKVAVSAGEDSQSVDSRPGDVSDLRALVEKVESEPLRQALRSLTHGASTIGEASKRIEAWFDQAMDRTRGWYARRAQAVILVAAALVVVALNADTVMIASHLWKDSQLRSQIVAVADEASRQRPADAPPMSPEEARRALEGFPIGWSTESGPRSLPSDAGAWLMKIAGLLVTIFSVSLGAPFWFDLLNRLVSIRSSGKPVPTARDKEQEEDRSRAAKR